MTSSVDFDDVRSYSFPWRRPSRSVFQQGSIFSIAIDPRAVVDVLRRAELPVDVAGPDDDWRRITIRPRSNGVKGNHALVLRLKTRLTDSVYFRKQLPAMAGQIRRLGISVPERQQAMTQLVPRLGTCIGMTAMPRFSDHPDFLEAITLVARTIDGMFSVPAGFLDAESRPLLMEDGTYDPEARVPALPEIDDVEDPLDEHAHMEMPSPRRVAERLLVMTVVAYRGLIESPEIAESKRAARLARLADWFWSQEIGHELEDHERTILDTPLGGLDPGTVQTLGDSFDAVAVLAWALRLAEMPSHDCFIDRRYLTDAIGLFSEDAHFIVDSADLRDAIDLRAQADRIMAIHWRLREWQLRPVAVDFAKVASETWFGSMDVSNVPLRSNDLAFHARPIGNADPRLVEHSAATIVHRHRAINWLCGHNAIYSEVQTAT